MPKLPDKEEGAAVAQKGAAVDKINEKIEQLGEEQVLLMKSLQVLKIQQDGYTKQLSVMSDQKGQLSKTQTNIRPFLLNSITEGITALAEGNARMIAIADMIATQEGELRSCYNDGSVSRNKDFAEDSSPTNQTVQVQEFLHQKRTIADVSSPDEKKLSKPCLAASVSSVVNEDSFNTVKEGSGIVKVERQNAVPQDAAGMAALSAAADAHDDTSSAGGSIASFGTGIVSSIDTHPPPLGDCSSEGGTVYNIPVTTAEMINTDLIQSFIAVIIPQSEDTSFPMEPENAIRKDVATKCLVLELNGNTWDAPNFRAQVEITDTGSGGSLPVVTLDPDGLEDLGLQLKTISGQMSDPRQTCSVVGLVQKRLAGSGCLQGIVQCMLGHETLPGTSNLKDHRIIPPSNSVSYSRHSQEGGTAQTYETSPGHQTWYWTVEGREFAAVPIIEIVNGNFNDFDGSYVQMSTLCNTLTLQETPLGVANLLQVKQTVQQVPVPVVTQGPTPPVLPRAVPFGDCSGNLSVLINSISDFAFGIGLPCGLVYNALGIDNATPDGVNTAAIPGQRSHMITTLDALNALSMELYCQRHRLPLTPSGEPTKISAVDFASVDCEGFGLIMDNFQAEISASNKRSLKQCVSDQALWTIQYVIDFLPTGSNSEYDHVSGKVLIPLNDAQDETYDRDRDARVKIVDKLKDVVAFKAAELESARSHLLVETATLKMNLDRNTYPLHSIYLRFLKLQVSRLGCAYTIALKRFQCAASAVTLIGRWCSFEGMSALPAVEELIVGFDDMRDTTKDFWCRHKSYVRSLLGLVSTTGQVHHRSYSKLRKLYGIARNCLGGDVQKTADEWTARKNFVATSLNLQVVNVPKQMFNCEASRNGLDVPTAGEHLGPQFFSLDFGSNSLSHVYPDEAGLFEITMFVEVHGAVSLDTGTSVTTCFESALLQAASLPVSAKLDGVYDAQLPATDPFYSRMLLDASLELTRSWWTYDPPTDDTASALPSPADHVSATYHPVPQLLMSRMRSSISTRIFCGEYLLASGLSQNEVRPESVRDRHDLTDRVTDFVSNLQNHHPDMEECSQFFNFLSDPHMTATISPDCGLYFAPVRPEISMLNYVLPSTSFCVESQTSEGFNWMSTKWDVRREVVAASAHLEVSRKCSPSKRTATRTVPYENGLKRSALHGAFESKRSTATDGRGLNVHSQVNIVVSQRRLHQAYATLNSLVVQHCHLPLLDIAHTGLTPHRSVVSDDALGSDREWLQVQSWYNDSEQQRFVPNFGRLIADSFTSEWVLGMASRSYGNVYWLLISNGRSRSRVLPDGLLCNLEPGDTIPAPLQPYVARSAPHPCSLDTSLGDFASLCDRFPTNGWSRSRLDVIQCSAFLSRAHSTDSTYSAGPHVFTPPPLTDVDGTPMDCVFDSASETPCLDENMLPHFQFSVYWIGMQMMFPAFAAPFGLHPSATDDGIQTVTGIPNQHVLNRSGKRKVFSIAQAMEKFGPTYQVPANQIRRSGVLAFAQHSGGSAGIGGFIPPQERDEDGRVPATVLASIALIILQSTDHYNTLVPGAASDSSGAMDRSGEYSCSTFDQSSDHEFSGPFAGGDPNPDGTLSIPVALRGSSGVPAASPTDMDAEVDDANDSRRFNLFTAAARCLGNSPIHVGDSMIRMAVDSKHIGPGFLSEALWGQHVREQKLLELLSVYEAACAYIYQYVAPPNEAQQEKGVPGTTFSIICGQAMQSPLGCRSLAPSLAFATILLNM